jgi:hypothetical protein
MPARGQHPRISDPELTLPHLDGVTSVRAERLEGIGGTPVEIDARNFY